MQKIKLSNYSCWDDYYWEYQNLLAKEYYIPYLKKQNINLESTIIDIGCGNGGFTSAFSMSKSCLGIDIKTFPWNKKKSNQILFKVHNILTDDNKKYVGQYDLIILRDVIEHINKSQKSNFIKIARSLMKKDGKMLITFPPYFSPFGLHQQAIMKTFLKKIPYLSLLPKQILKPLIIKLESDTIWIKSKEIIDSGITISCFHSILKEINCEIIDKEYFLIRPSHEIRYGVKCKKSILGKIPIIREVGVLGASYLIQKN